MIKHIALVFGLAVFLNAFDKPAFNPQKWVDAKFMEDSIEVTFDMCTCKESQPNPVGVKASLIEPIALIDVTPIPWGFPSWGFNFSKSGPKQKVGSARGSGAFRYTHTTRYPIFAALNMVTEGFLCFDNGGFDLGSVSEIKPWRNDDYLATFSPGTMLKMFFGNIVAELALATIDCPSTTLLNKPINSFYYGFACAGPSGTSANFTEGADPMMESHRLAGLEIEEASQALSTLWLPKTTNANFTSMPNDEVLTDSMCQETMPFVLIKDQYYLQQNYPVVSKPVRVGTYGPIWTFFKTPQFSGDEVVYALWRKRDFCAMAYKCVSLSRPFKS